MTSVILKGATVIDRSQGISGSFDLWIEGGKFKSIQPKINAPEGTDVIDLTGHIIIPGLIDLHCHLREPGNEGSETIASGTRAAAAGGYTTIYAMANTNPICDTMTGVHYVLSRAAKSGCGVRVVPVAAVTRGQKGEEITNFGILKKAGAGAFSDDFTPIMNAEVMRCALSYTKMLGVPIMDHCQDLNLTGDGVMHEGTISLQLGLKGIPRVAESIMVARNVALAQTTGGHVHISHISTRESVEIIREAKRSGVHVTTEVTPHHLLLTDQFAQGYNTMAKVMPPLCAEEDRQALIQGLRDETIDCIITDHAPHGSMAKNSVFDGAPFGVIGFESTLKILHEKFVATGEWSMDFLIEKLTQGPAKVMNIKHGSLAAGYDADFVVLQEVEPYKLNASEFESKSRNCPFDGEEVSLQVQATLVNGEIVWKRSAFDDSILNAFPKHAIPDSETVEFFEER